MRKFWENEKYYIFSGLVLVGIFSILPLVMAIYSVGVEVWKGVPLYYVQDSIYYFAQMKEVADGFFRAGNPYIFEYRNAIAPAFFVPVDIAAAPLLLGLSWSAALIFNWVLWGLVFLFLANVLLRKLYIEPRAAFFGSVAMYFIAYMFLMRPVALQLVFPVFLLFLIGLVIWLRGFGNSRYRPLFLFAAVISLSAYTYTYLAIIVALTMGVTFLYFLVCANWKRVKELMIIGISAIVFTLPFLFFILMPQLSSPWYQETLIRIGLIESRFLPIDAWYQGRWAVLAVIASVLIYAGVLKARERMSANTLLAVHFVFFSGVGLFLATISNLFTNKELITAIHIGRFTIVWLVVVVLLFGILLWRYRRKISPVYVVATGLILALCSVALVRHLPRSFAFVTDADPRVTAEVQSYHDPIAFLDDLEDEPVVVWAEHDMSEFVPVLSKHYVLFRNRAVLQIMPSDEIFERFVAAQMGPISRELIVSRVDRYLGAGFEEEQPMEYNRQVLYCSFLSFDICPPQKTVEQFYGAEFYDVRYERAQYIERNKADYLKEFDVKYLILDTAVRGELPGIAGVEFDQMWANDRYVIYRLLFDR